MKKVRVRVPGSKSMTQRALLMAALAEAPTVIRGALQCDDSRHLAAMLEALGCTIAWQGTNVTVQPAQRRTGLRAPERALDCGNAGTAVRFGACLVLICEGALTLDGDTHMHRRPIDPLVACLRQLGVEVRYLARAGCPPLRLKRTAKPPAHASIDTSISSQYASGLAMVAPRLAQGLELEMTGKGVSAPYLKMTVSMMRAAGVEAAWRGAQLVVPPGRYQGGEVLIEPDWSAAAFMLAAGHVGDLEVTIEGLPAAPDSLQGDSAFAAMLARLDRQLDDRGHNAFDLTACPDLIAPLVVACLFARAPSHIDGVAHARVKESDRLAVLTRELCALGAEVHERPDGLDIMPLRVPMGLPLTSAGADVLRLDPDGDHRMAMAFGVLSLRLPQLEIADRTCVGKSFPDFWDALERLRAAMG